MQDIIRHYDLLIDENNDPVRDPQPLRDYMDKWDGQLFIDLMELDGTQSALEIGVGTGRLAQRVAPLCARFAGVDISPKTVARARENLAALGNVHLVCADFMELAAGEKFDVIYSSLTFMHFRDKPAAVRRVRERLKHGGRFALSIDKNPQPFIDMGDRRLEIYPDDPGHIRDCIRAAGMELLWHGETEFAHIFLAVWK